MSEVHTSTGLDGGAITAASGRVLPRVILHTAVSIDGCISGFEANLGVYYGLVDTWQEDVTLVGAETILRATPSDAEEPSAVEDIVPEVVAYALMLTAFVFLALSLVSALAADA
jgi:hypothetical protein